MSHVIALTNDPSMFENRPRVVIITGPGYQDHDNIYCGYRFREAYFQVTFATAAGAPVIGKYGTTVPLDKRSSRNISFDDLRVEDFDAVVLTGGHEAPDRVRQVPAVKDFVAAMAAEEKVVAGLCHGPWVMSSARIMAGRSVAAYPGLRDDLEFAGATIVDADVVVDDNIITCSYYGEAGLFAQTVIAETEKRFAGIEVAA